MVSLKYVQKKTFVTQLRLYSNLLEINRCSEGNMSKCPHCKMEIILKEVKKEIRGAVFLKQEIMYSCPHCETVIGFSRGKYG